MLKLILAQEELLTKVDIFVNKYFLSWYVFRSFTLEVILATTLNYDVYLNFCNYIYIFTM